MQQVDWSWGYNSTSQNGFAPLPDYTLLQTGTVALKVGLPKRKFIFQLLFVQGLILVWRSVSVPPYRDISNPGYYHQPQNLVIFEDLKNICVFFLPLHSPLLLEGPMADSQAFVCLRGVLYTVFIVFYLSSWWFATFFMFTPNLGGNDPNFTSIFFKRGGSTTN